MDLKLATQLLRNSGVSSPELDARILLQEATQKTREFFIINPNYTLTDAEIAAFQALINRRIKREPISQILGKKEFYGRDFVVNAHVLTPRPETELIIDIAKTLFKPNEKLKILELGVGSGCIICTLVLEFPLSKGIGVDISDNALAIAKKNAYNHSIQEIEFYCSDWTENIEPQKFDLVVSNPPYIKATEKNNLEADLGFEPQIALYAGNSGLDAYKKIALGLKNFSFRYAILEIGQGQEVEVEEIFNLNGFSLAQAEKDLAGITRTLVFTKTA